MPERSKAIILGCTHGGLAVARSLGKRGIPFLVLTYVEREFGLRSRYVKEWHICPHPRDEKAFIDTLLSYADKWHGAVIFETNDYYATAVSRNKEQLSQSYYPTVDNWENLQTFLEKNRAYALAEEVGVLHPKVAEPKTMEDLEAVINDFQLPVMIKPVHSHEFVPIFKTKLFICETLDDLREKFKAVIEADQAIVLSEIIPGTDYGTLERVQTYINEKGNAAAIFSNIKLRQTPPMYGVMRVGKSTKPNDEASELASKLLRTINYRGFASVEFKRDYRDNQLKLMEVNIRIPRSIPLPIASGIDFPWIIYQDKALDKEVNITNYNENTYLIEALADIVDFFIKDEDRNIKQFLQPYLSRHKVFSLWQFNDPMPFIYQISSRMIRFFSKSLGIYNSKADQDD